MKITKLYTGSLRTGGYMKKIYTLLLDALRSIRSSRRWSAQRRIEVQAVLEELMEDLPYIADGTHHWTGSEHDVFLNYLYPELPLAVLIVPRTYIRKYAKEKIWKLCVANVSYSIRICKKVDIPLIVIYPDDPIDKYTLANRIEEVLR